NDRLPRSPRARWSDPSRADSLSSGQRAVQLPASRRGCRGDPLLALRGRRVVLPLPHPLCGGRIPAMKAVVVALAAVALLSGCGGGGGGAGAPPPGPTQGAV